MPTANHANSGNADCAKQPKPTQFRTRPGCTQRIALSSTTMDYRQRQVSTTQPGWFEWFNQRSRHRNQQQYNTRANPAIPDRNYKKTPQRVPDRTTGNRQRTPTFPECHQHKTELIAWSNERIGWFQMYAIEKEAAIDTLNQRPLYTRLATLWFLLDSQKSKIGKFLSKVMGQTCCFPKNNGWMKGWL